MPELQRLAKAAGKPLAVSVAGLSEDDYVSIVTRLAPLGVDVFELNFSCPNASAPNGHGGLWCFDIVRMRSILEKLSTISSIPLAIKVSPYSNPAEIERVARMVNEAGNVSAVVTSNSFPQGYWVRHGQPVLAVASGGVAGRALQPIALGQVRQFRQFLDPHIDVAGVGGVESADDAERFMGGRRRHGPSSQSPDAAWMCRN
jgi:dihydroorotate dehydrogenase